MKPCNGMFRLDRIMWQRDATGHGMQASVEELQGAEETDRRAKEKAVKQAAAEAAAEKRKATLARVERMKDWDDEEVRMLEKALDKFPQVGIPLPLPLLPSAMRLRAKFDLGCGTVCQGQGHPG